MSKLSNKSIAVVALSLLASKGIAQTSSQIDEQKLYQAIIQIQKSAKQHPEFLNQLNQMQKENLEQKLQLKLSDDEFRLLSQAVSTMLTEGVDIKIVPPNKIILSTQEYRG